MTQIKNKKDKAAEIEINDPVYPVFMLEDNNSIVLVFPSLSFIEDGRIAVSLILLNNDLFLRLGLSGLVLVSEEFLNLLKQKKALKIAVLPMGYDENGDFAVANCGKILDVDIVLSDDHLRIIESYCRKTVQLQEPDLMHDKFLKLKRELTEKGISEEEAEKIARKVFFET